MTKAASDKIAEGLNEALATARGETELVQARMPAVLPPSVIDTDALDVAVRRFPHMLAEWRRIGRSALLPRHVDAIRLEYRRVLRERV